MNAPASDASQGQLKVRGSRASSVIVHRAPPDGADAFMDWERGITEVVAGFPGYQSTEIYPPADPAAGEWVIILHFDDAATLQAWLDSSQRAEWTARRPGEFRVRTLPSGFGTWFAGLNEGGVPLAHWKSFLVVLVVLYPAVMLLTLFVAPHTGRFGMPVALLIGNAASVSFLEWLAMPIVNRLLAPWYRATGPQGRKANLIGLFLILGALALMTLLFSVVT